MVAHSENGELSLMGGRFKAQRCSGFKPTLVPTVSLVGGASCLRVLRFYFVRFCGCISPEKLFQMRVIEYDDGPVAFQREVMSSRINEVCLSANQGGRRQLVDPVFRRHP
jgi:hypothetical protein